MFERLDTWLILALVLWLLIGFTIDRCATVKRLRKELEAVRRQEHRARVAAEKARREKRLMAMRKEAAVDYTIERWKEEVEELKREIEKKDRLLNQKWREARDNV